MKKIKRRATAAAIVALLVIAGLFVYVLRYIKDGTDWALFVGNQDLYTDGVLTSGTVKDRNGVMLATTEGGLAYSDDSAVRTSCLHVVGDFSGNIGSGVLNAFADTLSRYNLITGAYSFRDTGETVNLSIDSSLNVTAYNALNGKKGAVVVMNYRTGEVLCMASSTSYDPSNIPDLESDYYDGVYLNRCINATYPPGSVFKIITLTAALETVPDLFDQTFYCDGSVTVNGNEVVCAGVHGSQTIREAFANSCNCAFAELALEVGADTLLEYAELYGITSSIDLDGIETAAGNFDADVDDTALAWSGIGQSTDLVSPLSMACVAATVANNGTLVNPTILLDGDNGTDRRLSDSTAQTIAEMMQNNVVNHYGQGNFPGLNICAKTGTAEVDDGAPHSWFVGFLDDADHPYAFAVIAENSGSGLSAAGAIANTVLQAAVSTN
ncbi:MAG: penicillin-binding transpeptidase domain-containing protein [Oscillospiraceae bacterium]|jgi:cell division protein FtsI/penicillin-binding protein 2